MKKEDARRIARSLINSVPRDSESLIKILNFLTFFSELYKKEREVRDFILNPLVKNELKLAYIKTIGEKFSLPEKAIEVMKQMVELNLVPLIGEVRRFFEHEMERMLKLSKGFLVVARPIDDEVVVKIKQNVSKLLGREVSLEVQEDPSIIGGFVVKMPSLVLDASVRRSLEKLGG